MAHLLSFIDTRPPSPPETPLEPVLPPTKSITASPKSALLVENDELLLNLLKRSFKNEGYAVRTARNSEEGLRLYRDCAPFNVVLIDYCVPEGNELEIDYCAPQTNGIELAIAIRKTNPSQRLMSMADPRILRLIQKWLKAGVMEDGKWSEAKTGSPQGSVISPLLANIYLHYSFDLWVNAWRKKWAQGEVVVIRFADDTIVGFQYQRDADRFLENLRERLGKFGLELHPDKTRRIEFGRFAEQNRKRRGEGKPETFDFLGFTHISGKNGLGRFAVRRTTIRKRMRAKLRQVKQQLRERMHDPVPQTGGWVQSVVQGYFNYYAVPGNLTSLGVFRDRVLVLWWRALRRRSQKHRISWTRILALAQRWLPPPQVLHPFPDARFAATYLR